MTVLEAFRLPPLMQVGYGVRDARATAAFYTDTFGLGPFDFQEAQLDGDYVYEGAPSSCRLFIATCQSADVQLEFIEVLEGRHPCGTFVERFGEGINHLAFEVEDLDAVQAHLQACKRSLVARGSVTLESQQSLRYAWFDGSAPGLPLFEFVEFR